MIEDISQDHPDRMRIVIALNAGRCRIATPMVSTSNRTSVSAGTYSARPATRASTSRRTRQKRISCSALAAGRAREPWLSRLARQRLPVLFGRHFEPAERAPPFLHPDHDLESVGGGDQIGRAGGGAKQSLDLGQAGAGLSRSTVPMAPVISRTLWPRSTSNRRLRWCAVSDMASTIAPISECGRRVGTDVSLITRRCRALSWKEIAADRSQRPTRH